MYKGFETFTHTADGVDRGEASNLRVIQLGKGQRQWLNYSSINSCLMSRERRHIISKKRWVFLIPTPMHGMRVNRASLTTQIKIVVVRIREWAQTPHGDLSLIRNTGTKKEMKHIQER
jgi:hypothetical protein